MPKLLNKITILSSITMICGVAFASPVTFKPPTSCAELEGYDPAFASYEGRYLPENVADNIRVSGFYQLNERNGKLYAAFGGASSSGAKSSVTPGTLVVLDADTMQFEKGFALPFASHALSVDSRSQRAVVTHTHQNAFSIVNLETGSVQCLKPDTEYEGRHVLLSDDGSFHISYFIDTASEKSAVLMKYDSNGQYDTKFSAHVTEEWMSIPLYRWNGRLLTGGKGLKAVDPDTGELNYLTTETERVTLYNYVSGPSRTVLASSFSMIPVAKPNLVLFDPESNSVNSVYTGHGSVELAYIPESGQVFSTNFNSKTVTVAELDKDAHSFGKPRFINIQFEGSPSNLAARHTPEGTEVFVTPRGRITGAKPGSAVITKIRIANSVTGIDGIEQPGACTTTTFNMLDKQVTAPEPCRILDAKASYQADAQVAQQRLERIEKELLDTVQKLTAAKADLVSAQRTTDAVAIDKAGKAVADLEAAQTRQTKAVADVRLGIVVLRGLIAGNP